MSVTLLFPDGTTIQGADAADVLRAWGLLQWTPVKDLADVKDHLSERAWVLTETALDPALDDEAFLDALPATGLCAVSRKPSPVKPPAVVTRPPWRRRYPEPDDR